MNNKKTLIILVLAFVLLLGGAYLLYDKLGSQMDSSQLAAQESPSHEVDDTEQAQKIPAPDFTVYSEDKTAVTLSDFQGKPVVLNFWASWCGPCKSEMPAFEAAYAEYGQDIHFLMVNLTDGSRETVETGAAFIRESGYTFPVYYDTQVSAAAAYGVYSIPMTFFIDAEGYAVVYGMGAMSQQTLYSAIDMIYPPA